MSEKKSWKETWANFSGKRRNCCNHCGEAAYYGLLLIVVGAVTIGGFLIPSKIWLVVIAVLMIYTGYRLFTA